MNVIAEKIGKPISNVTRALNLLSQSDEPRPILIRALAGGVELRALRRPLAYEARDVYVEASRTMDIQILLAWVHGGGRGTKRAMSDCTQVSKVNRRVQPR